MPSNLFTTDNGGVVLRATQCSYPAYDFRVHKFILSLASPVFKDMFTFPQPPDQNHNEQPKIPIINFSEPPYILDMILRLIYPGAELPNIPNVSTLNDLFSVADKYNMTSLYPILRQSLKTFLPSNPFRVYIIACRFGFLDEAKQALRVLTPDAATLETEHEEDLRHISSIDLYRLMWFFTMRKRSGQARIREVTSLTPEFYYNLCCKHCANGQGFYEQLERRLQNLFEENPCAQFDDLNGVLDTLPDPPLGCAPEDLRDGDQIIDCPLRPSTIRHRLTLLANALNNINDKFTESSFEKKF